MFSNIFLRPASSVTPTFRPSVSLKNSGPTGAAISRATIFSASFVGKPDLTLRTMTSMALANSAVNALIRRLIMNERIQRGSA